MSKLSDDLANSQQTIQSLRAEVEKWQSGETHLKAADMLDLLLDCPNCRPTLDAFADQIRQKAISGLTPDEVKEIAKEQKWWPPQPINIPDSLFSRKARQ